MADTDQDRTTQPVEDMLAEENLAPASERIALVLKEDTVLHRRNLLITIVVVAVVFILAAAALALSIVLGSDSGSDEPGSGSGAQPGTVATASPPAGATGSTAPGGSSAPPSAGASGSAASSGNAGIAVRPTQPAGTGIALETLNAPPAKTLSMVVVPKGFKGASYDVTLHPYGWGPAGPTGGRLVAQIETSKPRDAAAKSLSTDFAKRNVTLWLTPADVAVIATGGAYRGVMWIRPQGDVGVLYLENVAADM